MIEEEFLNDLTTSIEITAANNNYIPSQKYKPSSMHCLRNMYFQMVGQPPEKGGQPYTSVGILETGTDRHLRLQEAVSNMRRNGFDCDYLDVETYIKENNIPYLEVIKKNGPETLLYNTQYNMSFACDGLVNYKGNYYIVEFKTEGNYKFDPQVSVDPTHYNQATAYSLSFGLDKVLFIYVDRNSLKMKCYLLEVTDTMKERVLSKIDQCNMYLNRQVIPPKDNVDYKICVWCAYRQFCKSLPKEEFKWVTETV